MVGPSIRALLNSQVFPDAIKMVRLPAMPSEWVIVLNADGTVLAVDGGAPIDWIGTRLESRTDVSAEVQHVVAATRHQLDECGATASMISNIVTSPDRQIRVLVLHAAPVRRVATDLRALLESTIRVMELQARAIDVVLKLDVAPDVPLTLFLDPEKMAWAITALIGNALRFVRRGTRLMPGGTIQVRARCEPAAARVIIEVQDDGSGIRQKMLAELLQRPPGQLHASGLALGLVQDVISAHGGVVELESSTETGQSGTTVRLTLPNR